MKVVSIYYNIPVNSIQCEKCGYRFVASSPNQKLCDECSTYQPMGIKIIKCEDCGCDVEVDSKDNETCKCKKCYKKYRREYKRIKEKERRDKLKNKIVDSTI